MPVLQVPSGEEGGPGGLSNLLKEEEKKEDEEEKKVDGDDEEEMEGKRRDEEDMHDSLMVDEGKIVKLAPVPYSTCLLPFCSCFKVFPPQKEEVKQPPWRDIQRPTSWSMWCFLRPQISCRSPPCHLPE